MLIMTLHTYGLYLAAVVLISCTPGPNIFYVTTRSIRFGFGPAMLGMMGCLLALTLTLVASVAGVSAFMLAVPTAFDILKIAGAAYLIFLGIQAWRAPVADDLAPTTSTRETASRWSHFRGGFLVGVSNPKLLVFAAAFFPQFIAADAPALPQFALLVATFLAIEACAYVTVASSARGLARYLVQAVWQRRINRLTGVIFAGFGCALLRYRP
jgi:threonine/homoserine/homoserine lactone efflux protein